MQKLKLLCKNTINAIKILEDESNKSHIREGKMNDGVLEEDSKQSISIK